MLAGSVKVKTRVGELCVGTLKLTVCWNINKQLKDLVTIFRTPVYLLINDENELKVQITLFYFSHISVSALICLKQFSIAFLSCKHLLVYFKDCEQEQTP